MPVKPIDLTGRKFGRWTVLEREPRHSAKGCAEWRCICDCGTLSVVKSEHLRNSVSKSCGCLRREFRVRSNEHIGTNYILRAYINGAKKRGLIWGLTETDFRGLITQNCHYCGVEPNQIPRQSKAEKFSPKFRYNGIDRKDNSLGYTIPNCVTCCGRCNKIKSDVLTYEEMVEVGQVLQKFRVQHAIAAVAGR